MSCRKPPELLLAVGGVEPRRNEYEDARKGEAIGELLPDRVADQDGPHDTGVAEGSDRGHFAGAQRVDHAQMADEREQRRQDEGEKLGQAWHLPGLERPAA